jgi:hypothetical protein
VNGEWWGCFGQRALGGEFATALTGFEPPWVLGARRQLTATPTQTKKTVPERYPKEVSLWASDTNEMSVKEIRENPRRQLNPHLQDSQTRSCGKWRARIHGSTNR